MAIYTVHAPQNPDGASIAPGGIVFVKEGFCWPALFIPLIWAIYRRLWLVVLFLLAAVLVLSGLSTAGGGSAVTVLYVLARVYVAFEANGLRRWTLDRNGYAFLGVVEGRRLEEAERRFFSEWEPGLPTGELAPAPMIGGGAAGVSAQPGPAKWGSSRRHPEVVGLFPTRGPGT